MVHDNIGVTYESGAADYAEWLPKFNRTEKFSSGDIVAVKGGAITKNTDNADQYMVISTKPIVLGNMPPKGQEADYEKVAFMGQVPVAVLGKVKKGYYILPTGNHNGLGMAISPENMKVSDYKKIVGVAWSDGIRSDVNIINVAVGLNTNSLSSVIEKQADEIRILKLALAKTQNDMKSQMAAVNNELSSIKQAIAQLATGNNLPGKITDLGQSLSPSKEKLHAVVVEGSIDKMMTPEISAQVEKAIQSVVTEKTTTVNTSGDTGFGFDNEIIQKAYETAKEAYASIGYDLKSNPLIKIVDRNPAIKEMMFKKIQDDLNGAVIDQKIKDAEQR
jgi:hypothetical protein